MSDICSLGPDGSHVRPEDIGKHNQVPQPGVADHRRICGCCQKSYDDPDDLAVFGILTDAGGKNWDLCGKCIQVMWRKRAPKLEPLV